MGYEREGRPPEGTRGGLRAGVCAAVLSLLAACTGSTSRDTNESEGLVLSGSVGDGPIVDAQIRVEDAGGQLVLTGQSDAEANYRMEIPDGTRLPVLIRVSGGTDLVTGRAADFELLGVSFDSGAVTVNASPYTTLAVQTARCMGELSPANMETAWEAIHANLNLGWDRSLLGDPMHQPVTEANVVTALLSSEALGEVVRRATAALAATDAALGTDALLELLACDLADGVLNGAGRDVDPRVALTAYATAAAVGLEVLAGTLQVDGEDAGARLDDALRTVMPGATGSVADLPPGRFLIEQVQDGLGVLGILGSTELAAFATALEDAGPSTARGQVQPLMSAANANALAGLPQRVALADDTLIGDLAARRMAPATRPFVYLAADEAAVTAGATTRLSWASADAEICNATGAWSGQRPLTGSARTAPLTAASEFVLTCLGRGGVASARVRVDVLDPVDPDPTPDPAPSVTLGSDRSSVTAGDSVRLTWSASDATGCTAGGGWGGSRPTAGNLQVGPLSATTTFTLDCTGPGGTGSGSVTVTVTATPPTPPTLSLSASPAVISQVDTTRLSWSSANTTGCTASGGWSGSRGSNGSMTLSPAASTTYTLTCQGPGGSVSETVSVQVNPPPADPPVVSLSLASSSIDEGGSTTLSWTAGNAASCTASGAWSGSRPTSGSLVVAPGATSTYTLTCSGDGGSDSASVTLTVNAQPPTLSFSASATEVNQGGSVTLTWTSTGTGGCTASGAWSGSRATSGSQLVGPVSAASTYTLSCSGAGGNVMQMLTVSAISPVPLTWSAPTENVDGTPLTDLAGYRIYYGTASRNYTDMTEITNPATTSHTLDLASGDYYVAMTALDQQGNESAYSNEVLKTAP